MSIAIRIARQGEDIGAWPFDIVFAQFRCGLLVATDTYQLPDMDEARALSEIIPPSPSNTRPAIFLGRDDDEWAWTFHCRDGFTVIGPRPLGEVIALILTGDLSDDDLIFIAGGERWTSIADWIRTIDKEVPEIAPIRDRVQAAMADSEAAASQTTRRDAGNSDWLQTGLNLAAVSPHIGGAYLGFNAVKRLGAWLSEPDGPAFQPSQERNVGTRMSQSDERSRCT